MNRLEWGRRRAGKAFPERAIDVLRDDPDHAEMRTGQNAVGLESIRSFYDLLHHGLGPMVCAGTACAFADGFKPATSDPKNQEVYCLGRCFEAPASSQCFPKSIPYRSLAKEPIVLRRLFDRRNPLDDYRLPSGDDILNAVADCGLKGRGGAAFPTGKKWRLAKDTPAPDRYVVANGDEGDPGSFVDRLLLEECPHAVLAGMAACAKAIGSRSGILYIRGEYPLAVMRVEAAIAEAKAARVFGEFDVRVVVGAGSYVAGEETALIRSIEGLRAEPWPKPPYPAQKGLHGLPTVVQNVETLAVVPWVLAHRRRADQKALSLSGAIKEPGIVEIELGQTLRSVVLAAGGAPPGHRIKMALIGGPMGRVLSEPEFDVRLSFEDMPGMGHGGIVFFDERVRASDLLAHLYEFARKESCGNCAPCRIGCAQLESRRTPAELERLLTTLEEGSMCGFGQGVPRPIRDLMRLFPEEIFR